MFYEILGQDVVVAINYGVLYLIIFIILILGEFDE